MERFLPTRHPIDYFGNGGFRFGGMSHQGSLLISPGGMRALQVDDIESLRVSDLAILLAEKDDIDFLLIGTGKEMVRPPASVMAALGEAKMQCDFMDTNAAVRTYNVVLDENRRVAAIMIAVDHAAGR